MAKAYDFINEHDSAFKYFRKANELTNKSHEAKNFDRKKYLQSLEIKKNYFTKKNIIQWNVTDFKVFLSADAYKKKEIWILSHNFSTWLQENKHKFRASLI